MAQAPTALAHQGPISSSAKGIKALDVSKAPIPLPNLTEGQRCFRSRSRGFRFIVHDTKPKVVDGHFIDGEVKIAEFQAMTGLFDGQVYDFGELVTKDAEIIAAVESHPEYNRLMWDGVTRKQTYNEDLKAKRIEELKQNPELLAAVRAELFDLGEPEEVKRGPGRPRKNVEAES